MSFCTSDWEGHAFSGAFPSSFKTKPNFSIEAPLVPDDVFEELCWEDGQLMYTSRPNHKQVSSWAANAPVQATRDHGVSPLHAGGNAASLTKNVDAIVEDTRAGGSSPDIFDDEMIAWLQYPPDVDLHGEKMYSKHPVVSHLPSISFEKSDGAPYRSYTLMAAVDRERHSMKNDNGSQQGSTGPHARSFGPFFQSPTLAYTADANPGSVSTPIVSPKAALSLPHVDPALSLPHVDPYNCAQNSLQSLSRLAAEWEPDASVPSLQAVIDGSKRIHQQNAGTCVSTDSSMESTVTGISLQDLSALVDPHVADCAKATSVTLHQVHEPIPVEKPDAITCMDALGALHSTGTGCEDGADIKTFSKSKRTQRSGSSAKGKGKDSDDSESETEDLTNQRHLSQGFSTKRSRAAEIHNKSEKKRRERINEKLKALQELVPNANKTDKASLLGEAIEYLKALQAQIMVMSYRTGITIPPMLISHGMLHPYVPPPGFGAGFVMNKNGKGVSVAMPANSSMRKTSFLKPLMPLPPLPSPASLVGIGNYPSTHVVGYNANCLPMVNAGLVSPSYHLQTHPMPIHDKPPSFL